MKFRLSLAQTVAPATVFDVAALAIEGLFRRSRLSTEEQPQLEAPPPPSPHVPKDAGRPRSDALLVVQGWTAGQLVTAALGSHS